MKKEVCTMKKLFALLLTLSLVLSLAACGSKEEAAEEGAEEGAQEETVDYASMSIDDLKAAITTVTEGTLTVATSPDFAPYEFYALDENGDPQLAGFDMDLAQYIADYLGLTLEVIPMDFDGTIMELQSGNVDLGMAGYSPTFTSPAASPSCVSRIIRTCSPLWRLPITPIIPSAPRWVPSRRAWPGTTLPTPTSWS